MKSPLESSGSVINEAAGTAALKIFRLGVNGGGEFLFEAMLQFTKRGRLQRAGVGGERGRARAGGGDASGGRGAGGIGEEESVLAGSGVGTGDQEDGRGLVDEPDAGREFRLSRVVEDISCGETRGAMSERWIDGVPIETDAGFDQKAVGDAPAIFNVSADLLVELLVQGSRGEGGVAGAGKILVLRGGEAEVRSGQAVVAVRNEMGWRKKRAS